MKALILIAASLALASCTTTPPVASPSSGAIAQAGSVILTGERGFAAAELGYITAAKAVGALADAGVIRGATATQVRAWNATARDLLVKGKATADAAEKARIATQLFGITDRLAALTGRI